MDPELEDESEESSLSNQFDNDVYDNCQNKLLD